MYGHDRLDKFCIQYAHNALMDSHTAKEHRYARRFIKHTYREIKQYSHRGARNHYSGEASGSALALLGVFLGGLPRRLLGVLALPSCCREAVDADLLTLLLPAVAVEEAVEALRRGVARREDGGGEGEACCCLSIGGRTEVGSQVGHFQSPSGIPLRPTQ